MRAKYIMLNFQKWKIRRRRRRPPETQDPSPVGIKFANYFANLDERKYSNFRYKYECPTGTAYAISYAYPVRARIVSLVGVWRALSPGTYRGSGATLNHWQHTAIFFLIDALATIRRRGTVRPFRCASAERTLLYRWIPVNRRVAPMMIDAMHRSVDREITIFMRKWKAGEAQRRIIAG